ncbi:hypothetical protein [Helicobacter sp. WB40]|uniref:hypothetical protein n=1 Tax=Helicobacter sp. WB40 TaxID=3004130 RepID=UPI0022EC15F4|nr:hypothetical protein [Helicobacter sp. WB40]MDA3966818.1 hypothetical protein [Helicobacter sp. WB40]
MQDWFIDYLKLEYKKYISLMARSLNIQDLALGSSHGNYGYIPNNNGFNLANTSQDLYTSYSLYLYVQNLPLLKNIFLFYSIFSPGYNLILSGESHFATIYKLLYNIDYNKIAPPPQIKYHI